jgi:hypothetical protein
VWLDGVQADGRLVSSAAVDRITRVDAASDLSLLAGDLFSLSRVDQALQRVKRRTVDGIRTD